MRFLYSLVIAIKLSADGSPNGRGWNSLVFSLKTNPLECYDSSSHPVFGLVHDSVGSFTNLLELLIPLHASRQTGSRVVVETAYGTAALVMEVPAKWERPDLGRLDLCSLPLAAVSQLTNELCSNCLLDAQLIMDWRTNFSRKHKFIKDPLAKIIKL